MSLRLRVLLVAQSHPVQVIFRCPLSRKSYTIDEIDEVAKLVVALIMINGMMGFYYSGQIFVQRFCANAGSAEDVPGASSCVCAPRKEAGGTWTLSSSA